MSNLEHIKHLRAQDYGVAGLSTTDVDWLIAEVERLTAERNRYKARHDRVMAVPISAWLCGGVAHKDYDTANSYRHWLRSGAAPLHDIVPLIVRPQPLKENE